METALAWLAGVDWTAVMQIILIDILLGGDNAVIIALACRNLPAKQRKKGIFWGVVGAITLRVILISFAVALLDLPFLKLVGGLLLVWIGVKLIAPSDEDEHANLHASDKLWSAIKTIIVADFVYAFSTYYQATNISNLDVLLHSLIKYDCHPKVIVLADKSERQHVDKLNAIYPLHGVLVLPVKEGELEALLQSAIAGGSETA